MIPYPTIEQVEQADIEKLAYWYRFLPSPGACAAGSKEFSITLRNQKVILDRICERFSGLGGWNPALSKKIGLENG